MLDPLEVYVLCKSRSSELAVKFLNTFSPDRTPDSDEYCYPQYEDNPTDVFSSVDPLLHRLEIDKNESYSLYWNSHNDLDPIMLFYTQDGDLIAGVAGSISDPYNTIQLIANCVGGIHGYVTLECPPPQTRKEFIDICANSTFDTLYEGNLRRTQIT